MAPAASVANSDAAPTYVILHEPVVVPVSVQPYCAAIPEIEAEAWTVEGPAVTVTGDGYPHEFASTPGAH